MIEASALNILIIIAESPLWLYQISRYLGNAGLYNLNRDNLGHFHSDDNSAVQQVAVFDFAPGSNSDDCSNDNVVRDHLAARHIHTAPVYWQSRDARLIFVASDWGLGVKAYKFNDNGLLETHTIAVSPGDGYAISELSLSASGR